MGLCPRMFGDTLEWIFGVLSTIGRSSKFLETFSFKIWEMTPPFPSFSFHFKKLKKEITFMYIFLFESTKKPLEFFKVGTQIILDVGSRRRSSETKLEEIRKNEWCVSDMKIIQTTRKSSYFAFITAYKGKVTGFSSSLDDFSVRHNPLVFSYLHYFSL